MNRFALIFFASNIKGQVKLPGAKRDAELWYNYLRSNCGGSWQRSEIFVKENPSYTQIDTLLEEHKDDYCFVAFSGHGCEIKQSIRDEKGVPTVCLNNDEQTVPLFHLKPKGQYGTLISDSCRGYEIMEKKASGFSNRSDKQAFCIESINYLSCLHQAKWFQALNHCCNTSGGVLTMYSCATGQSAEEDPDAGGLYTSLLINSANKWYSSAKGDTFFTTWGAHINTIRLMRSYSPQQTPEYLEYPIRFPFAIKV